MNITVITADFGLLQGLSEMAYNARQLGEVAGDSRPKHAKYY